MAKTVDELIEQVKTTIQQLDEASGALYNALDNLGQLRKSYMVSERVQNKVDRLDVMLIDSIKNDLEQFIEGAEE